MFRVTKHAEPFAYAHRAHFAGPCEHILKQMFVDCPVVGMAKPPARQRFFTALCGDERLEIVELRLIAQAKAIPEDVGWDNNRDRDRFRTSGRINATARSGEQ